MPKSLIFLLLMCMSVSSYAAAPEEIVSAALDAFQIDEDKIEGAVGVGILIETEPYIGVDEKIIVVPLAKVEYKNLYFDGRTFGYTFNQDEEIEVSLAFKPRIGVGFEASDSPFLAGMEEREDTFDGGMRFELKTSAFEVTVEGVADLTNQHEGHDISVKISKELFRGMLTPRVGVSWYSENYVKYYYGVKGSESSGTRTPYEGDASLQLEGGLTVAIPLGRRWALVGDVAYQSLGDEIRDSPIIEKEEIYSYAAGVVYRF